MTLLHPVPAKPVPRHLEPEAFRTFAHQQLAVATPWQTGICFNPSCGAVFQSTRDWKIYCCTACEREGTKEMRKWGHRMALSLLIWRMGKYEEHNEGIRDLTRAARRHVGYVQSAWLDDRRARARARG